MPNKRFPLLTVAAGWLRRHRDDVAMGGMIVGLAIAVFIFFKSFFDANPDSFTVEILAALLGSILTVMITMLLIKRQGSIEQAQEAAAMSKTKVFEKKLELFREFISIYVRSAQDEDLTPAELGQLEEIALTISLFTKDVPVSSGKTDLGEELCRFVLQLELFGLRRELLEEDHSIFDEHLAAQECEGRSLLSFVHILRLMKIELGIAQSEIDEVDSKLLEFEYEWTSRLLTYNGYRRVEDEVSPPQSV